MKRAISLQVALTIAGGLLLTKVVYQWPALLPTPAKLLGLEVIRVIAPESAEAGADAELVYTLVASTLVAGVGVAMAKLAWSAFRGRGR